MAPTEERFVLDMNDKLMDLRLDCVPRLHDGYPNATLTRTPPAIRRQAGSGDVSPQGRWRP
jgi:hypothetical protein